MLTRIHAERRAAATGPSAGCDLTQLTNDELMQGTRRLVGASNQVFAMLLAHLAEVETRGVYRERACSSLYTYCIYELRFSEDAAFRRVSAARLVKRFPVLYDAVASGELHLTGLLMLGPLLTPENHLDVLARAKHRTKKELTKLLRELAPFPELPARIEPLGPALARPASDRPSWEELVGALSPLVRELGSGAAPRGWMSEPWQADSGVGREAGSAGSAGGDGLHATPSDSDGRRAAGSDSDGRRAAGSDSDGRSAARSDSDGHHVAGLDSDGREEFLSARGEPIGPALARSDVTPVSGPLRYGVQFSAQEEYVELVERAKALLSHAHSKSSLEEIHLRAMRLLVADLEKQRFATTARPRKLARPPAARKAAAGHGEAGHGEAGHGEAGPGEAGAGEADPGEVVAGEADPGEAGPADAGSGDAGKPPRGRHIPAAARRSVFERDGARCTYVDGAGERCRETHQLELHHLEAFGRGGTHAAANLTLRCRAHNGLAAEQDFGRARVERAKQSRRHEAFAAQQDRG